MKSKMCALMAGAMVCVAGIVTAQAQSTIVTFSVDMSTNVLLGTFVPGTDTVAARGTFNGYGTLNLVQDTSQLPEYIYTNTVNDTADANGTTLQYKFWDSNTGSPGWEPTATGQNRAALLPTTSGASLVLPTAFYGDAGAPVVNNVTFQVDVSQQVNLGGFTPGTSSVEVRGNFNSWSGGVTVLTNSTATVPGEPGNPIWAGTYPVTNSPGGAQAFKYVIQPGTSWDSPAVANQDGGQNRYFANVAQTLPLVFFSDAPYSLQFCTNVFNVDMSAVVLTDTNFDPSSLTLNGSFNGWGAGIPMTNNPNAANTNLFTSSGQIFYSAGASIFFQYRYTLLTSPSTTVYDHLNGINGGSGNRVFVEPLSIKFTNLPAVYFNDANVDDYLTHPTPVLFSVDMSSAVAAVGSSDAGYAFNPATDTVYVNGQFASWYAWGGGVNPSPAPGSNPGVGNAGGPYLMVRQGSTAIYTNTLVIPAGTPVAFTYKYGMDPSQVNGGPLDNEAASGQNHYRVVRSTGFNPYSLPQDTFGNQYNEPFFSSQNTAAAGLKVGPQSGGTIPVSWLGRPGASLQSASSLTGPWQNNPLTDGTNWTAGSSSTNGFVSVTNWPAGNGSGKLFFRLIKP